MVTVSGTDSSYGSMSSWNSFQETTNPRKNIFFYLLGLRFKHFIKSQVFRLIKSNNILNFGLSSDVALILSLSKIKPVGYEKWITFFVSTAYSKATKHFPNNSESKCQNPRNVIKDLIADILFN